MHYLCRRASTPCARPPLHSGSSWTWLAARSSGCCSGFAPGSVIARLEWPRLVSNFLPPTLNLETFLDTVCMRAAAGYMG